MPKLSNDEWDMLEEGCVTSKDEVITEDQIARCKKHQLVAELTKAAVAGHEASIDLLLHHRADVNSDVDGGSAPLRTVCSIGGKGDAIESLLKVRADANKSKALHMAAFFGGEREVRLLLEAKADPRVRGPPENKTPAEYADQAKRPMLFALLDPAAAEKRGKQLLAEFRKASLVHVISTRFTAPQKLKHALEEHTDLHPKWCAEHVKSKLEQMGGEAGAVRVFNPNSDNAYIMRGDSSSANAIWLRNWRDHGLKRARETGGFCIQVLARGVTDLSEMQHAEASMAEDQGVPVVRIAFEKGFEERTEWKKVAQLTQQAREGKSARPWADRGELLKQLSDKDREMQKMREEVESLRERLAGASAEHTNPGDSAVCSVGFLRR